MADEQGAIPEGMKAWAGGLKPADWDGGPVLLRDQRLYTANQITGEVLTWHWSEAMPFGDIIAYTPAADGLTDTGEKRTWEPCACGHDNEDDVCAYHDAIVLRRHSLATPKPPVDAGAMREAADARERRAALALATCHADALEEHGEPPSWREMARAVFAVTDQSDAGEPL